VEGAGEGWCPTPVSVDLEPQFAAAAYESDRGVQHSVARLGSARARSGSSWSRMVWVQASRSIAVSAQANHAALIANRLDGTGSGGVQLVDVGSGAPVIEHAQAVADLVAMCAGAGERDQRAEFLFGDPGGEDLPRTGRSRLASSTSPRILCATGVPAR